MTRNTLIPMIYTHDYFDCIDDDDIRVKFNLK